MSEIMDLLITVSFHYGEVNNNKPKLNQWGIKAFKYAVSDCVCLGAIFDTHWLDNGLTHIGCHTPS